MTDLTIDDVDEGGLLGEPLEDVPKIAPDDKCRGRKTEGPEGDKVFAGYCGSVAGKETDHLGEGRCKFHGGNNSGENGQGGTEDNTNAVTHGAYADENSYYQNVLGDAMREFVDDVFEDYLERYKELHGDPPLGIEAELFRVSVSHAKDIGLDQWADEKPEELESSHPLVDKETTKKSLTNRYGETEIIAQRRYRKSVVQRAQMELSRDRRMWLKDLGLLEDPESQKADSIVELKEAWIASAQGGES